MSCCAGRAGGGCRERACACCVYRCQRAECIELRGRGGYSELLQVLRTLG